MSSSFIHREHDFIDYWIRKKARSLLHRYGLAFQDLEDLQQTLWLRVLTRLPTLTSRSVPDWPIPFLHRILDQGVANFLRDRMANKRLYSRTVLFCDLRLGFENWVAQKRNSDSFLPEFRMDWDCLVLYLGPLEQQALQFLSRSHRYGLRKPLGLNRSQFRQLIGKLQSRLLRYGFAPEGMDHE
jgi:hypothetical protein